ncbi:phosphatase PAP2 family protein [Actinomadura sp. NBRC 104412]|uniref:phosphatase PAP2 family protein n=1 Tax=Actinomadura sp. NBRC 104412 TaxID=3032203 RepID=UPI002553EC5C|nr:phosphatase PAP2 family protein [Actinomadura sp. NBRC 104412]
MKDQSPMPGGRRLKVALVGGLSLAAIWIAGIALGDRVPPLDSWIVGHLYSRPRTVPSAIAAVVSGAGTVIALALLLATVSDLLRRRRAQGARLLARHAALLTACLATMALQAVFQRPGPPVTAQDWTYPSGHVTLLTALAFTAFMISRELTAAWRATVLVASTATLVAVSAGRVTLGEHYLLDVVAAVLATLGVGLITVAVLNLTRNPAPLRESRSAES